MVSLYNLSLNMKKMKDIGNPFDSDFRIQREDHLAPAIRDVFDSYLDHDCEYAVGRAYDRLQ